MTWAMVLHLRLRTRPPCRRPPVLAAGPGIAASPYVVFALRWAEDAALWRELGGVAAERSAQRHRGGTIHQVSATATAKAV